MIAVTGRIPKRAAICQAMLLVCLSGVVLLPLTAIDSQTTDFPHDPARYARQTICDLPFLPNLRTGVRKTQSPWSTGAFHGLDQPPFHFAALPARVGVSFTIELRNPQSLAVCNPTTRSPPA
ncbi:MAG: hypothetical protein LIP77_06460 [Planctomycetes bacterium]|nr:hypothetical protein [Planctomycetota bacterium]